MDGLELLRSFADHRSRKMDALYTDQEYNKDLASYTGEIYYRSRADLLTARFSLLIHTCSSGYYADHGR